MKFLLALAVILMEWSAIFATMVPIELDTASIIHIWMRAKQPDGQKPASLLLESSGATRASHNKPPLSLHATTVHEWFDFKQVEVAKLLTGHEGKKKKQPYRLVWSPETTEIAYIYVFEKETVKEAGIRPAYIRAAARHHSGLNKHSFHLRTPLGWANEPNGFTRTNDGLYHVFYQHIPNLNRRFEQIDDQIFDTLEGMHWGHSVSTDLINWVHQPIFLLPKFEKEAGIKREHWIQHWFSGSAIPMDAHGVRVFVTNFKLGRKNLAMQTELVSSDGIVPDGERLIVDEYPANPSFNGIPLRLKHFNFRDPNVFRGPHGYWYMTIGTEDVGEEGKREPEGGAILLYRQTKPNDAKHASGWQFQSVLLTDRRDGFENIECPGMVPMGEGNFYALIYAREWGKEDALHRDRDTLVQLGTFDGKTFKKISEQTLDFAYGSYGHQGFYEGQNSEALLLGWQAWWNDWDFRSDFFSSQTLPRVLRMAPAKDGLLIGPHPAVLAQLRGDHEMEWKKGGGDGHLECEFDDHQQRTAYIRLEIEWGQHGSGHVFVDIGHPKYSKLGVKIGQAGLELVKDLIVEEAVKDRRPLLAKNARPDIVHIFIDIDSMEIYGELASDGGTPRWTGTTRLTGNGEASVHRVRVMEEGGNEGKKMVTKAQIWPMKPAKMVGYFMDEEEEEDGGHDGRPAKKKLAEKVESMPAGEASAAVGEGEEE